LTASAKLTDAAGNESAAGTDTAIKDTVAPSAPTVDIVPAFVNSANKTAMSVTGSGEVGATGSSGTITSSGGVGSVALSGTIPAGGTLTLSPNPTRRPADPLTASAKLTDAAGNESAAGTDTAIKDTVAPSAPTVDIVPAFVNSAN